ncbi:WecB/TagA/CpsF family glycosyltransferase [Vibrio vulnificus]|uniref:WecB/TagA/CpsF family glycosyltransferase n=1 Tax=Vibrio vulnificus TaxID=672 RepID=UPI0038CD79A8
MKVTNFDIECLKVESGFRLFTFVNPFSYYLLKRECIDSNFQIFADGIFFVKLHNLFSDYKIKRFSFDFTSLADVVLNYCSGNNYKVALVGGSQHEIFLAQKILSRRYPKLDVIGHHGYFFGQEDELRDCLRQFQPDVIICGMGTPLQERFLLEFSQDLPSLKLGFTCGGFLSQISSNENYFHPFFDRLNLRWLQRFFRHGYVRKRLLVDYPIFTVRYVFEKVTRKL